MLIGAKRDGLGMLFLVIRAAALANNPPRIRGKRPVNLRHSGAVRAASPRD